MIKVREKEKIMKDEIRLSKTFIIDCRKYICDNFNQIFPFELRSEYRFHIRFTPEIYKNLPDKYKSELRQFAHIEKQWVDDDIWKRYLTDFYWRYTNEHIFKFETQKALHLKTKCIWGYEGVESCDKELVFMDDSIFTQFIRLNIGKNLADAPVLPEKV